MTTLSPAKARAKLSHWLKRAAAGDDIGIQFGDKVIALRPLPALPGDSSYARREYRVTEAELAEFARRMDAEIARDLRAGRLTRFRGDMNAALRD